MACLLSAPCCEVERAPGRDVFQMLYKRVGSYRVGVETVLQRSSRRESHNDPRSIVRLWSVSDFRDESAVQARRARSQAGFSQISRRDRREVLERVALPVSGLVGDPHPMNENSKTISGRAGRSVRTRNAVAAGLRRQAVTSKATEIQRLRKPSSALWAANHLAHEYPGEQAPCSSWSSSFRSA